MRAVKWTGVLLTILLGGLSAAGCGGDDDRAAQDAETENREATERAVRVSMLGRRFVPASVTVERGGAVYWTNRSNEDHTVTRRSGPGQAPNSGNIGRGGGTYVDFFRQPGKVTYYCQYHPREMRGTIIVK